MQRVNHLPRRVISIVLTIVMVASLFSGILPGLGVTAKAAANEIANDSLKISVGDLGQISTAVMEKRKMYNIKKGVWHNLAGNEQMVLLIVENADTSKGNSDFFPVTADMLP